MENNIDSPSSGTVVYCKPNKLLQTYRMVMDLHWVDTPKIDPYEIMYDKISEAFENYKYTQPMKYTKKDVIEKRISFKPMTEQQHKRLVDHFGYGRVYDMRYFYRFYPGSNKYDKYGYADSSYLNLNYAKSTKEISFDEFDFEGTLKMGDKVELMGIEFEVNRSHLTGAYFLNRAQGNNDIILTMLNIDHIPLTKKVLGYYTSGVFPYCNNLKDLTKLVDALKLEISHREKLPEKWAFEVTKENYEEFKHLRWLCNQSGWITSNSYTGLTWGLWESNLPKGFTEISFETFKHHFLTNKTEIEMRTLSYQDAQRIINVACSDWAPKLAEKWGVNIALRNYIDVSEDFYREMRRACTDAQHLVFDEIFGKNADWHPGELYWVKNSNVWNLRYASDGEGLFYDDQLNLRGCTSYWSEYKLATGVKLPE